MNIIIPYDELWKEVLEALYSDFLQFFLPDFSSAIDWTKKYESLDKELRQISPKSEERKRFVDKLTKVYLKDVLLVSTPMPKVMSKPTKRWE